MKKRLCILVLSLCLTCALALSVSAGTPYYMIFDDAGLLEYSQEESIKENGLAAMREANMGDVEINIIITPHFSYSYSDAMRNTHILTEDQDMILLVIYWDSFRDYYEYEVVTFGKAQRAISNARQDDIADAIYSDVKAGRLAEACSDFMRLSAEAYRTEMEIRIPRIVGISLGAGALGALIAVLSVVLSYRRKKRSPSYPLKEFSQMTLTLSDDICTGRNVTKVRLSSSSGSSGSSGGRGGGRSSGRR